MRFIRNKVVIAVFSTLLMAVGALAQNPAPTPPPHGFGHGGFGGPMFGMFFHHLDLTDAQKAQFKQIMTQERPTLKPLMQQMEQGENQLRQLELSGNFSEDQARTIAAAQSQNATELMVQHARIENELIQILTPDQKTKLGQMVQQRSARFAGQNQNQAAPANQ
jgi:protein CpxP